MHSTASDGTDAPEALPRLARDAGLGAIALTDHDTTAGLARCAQAAEAIGIGFLPGIELSVDPATLFAGAGSAAPRIGTLHLLGYGVRPDEPGLAAVEARLRDARDQRNPRILDRLRELGVRIDLDEVVAEAGGQIVGRPHIAQVLLRKGYVKSIHEAFIKYIGEGAPAHVRKDRLSAAEAIDTLHDAGALAVLAHPVQMRLESEVLDQAVARLRRLGLDGIETRHSDHTPADVRAFEKLAERFGLLTTGGSDYHGERKPIALGSVTVPIDAFEQLRAAGAAGPVTDQT